MVFFSLMCIETPLFNPLAKLDERTCRVYGIQEGVLKSRKRCYTTLRKKSIWQNVGYKYNVFGHLPPPNPPLGTQKSMHYNDQNQNELFTNTPHLTIHNPRQHQLSITIVEFLVPRSYLSVQNAREYHQGKGQHRHAM